MRLLLVGGGHAHAAALRAWRRDPHPAVDITLLTRAATSLYSGMLPGVIRGDYPEGAAQMDMAALAARAGGRVCLGDAIGVDLAGRAVTTAQGARLGFDVLSLDVGGESGAVPGTVPARPIEALPGRIAALEAAVAGPDPVVVAGGGPAGVELALALAWRWRGTGRRLLLCTDDAVLAEAPRAVRDRAVAALGRAGVAVRSVAVAGASPGLVRFRDGSTARAAAVVWAAGVVAPAWLGRSGLAVDALGFVRVDRSLRGVSHPCVTAAGDCATVEGAPRPKGGAWAVRAGPALAATWRALADGKPAPAWHPAGATLSIIGLGGGRALAWRGRWWLAGRAAWWWKDWLDRRWMADGRS